MAYSKLKKTGIHHVSLRVPDLKKAAGFYTEGLGAVPVVEWGEDGANDHAVILDLGAGDFLEIFETSEDFGTGRWNHVAILTSDMDKTVERAVAAGAKLVQEPRDSHIPARSGEIVNLRFCFLLGPGGETLELIQDI